MGPRRTGGQPVHFGQSIRALASRELHCPEQGHRRPRRAGADCALRRPVAASSGVSRWTRSDAQRRATRVCERWKLGGRKRERTHAARAICCAELTGGGVPGIPSWNQVAGWPREMDSLRVVVGGRAAHGLSWSQAVPSRALPRRIGVRSAVALQAVRGKAGYCRPHSMERILLAVFSGQNQEVGTSAPVLLTHNS
jgi:hypothetical protein